MGIKGLCNRKRSFKSAKSQKWQRAVKAEKKKNLPAETVEIEDVHLFSKEKLKNKLRNPRNNIKITGKKKRRLTKRLGHSLREKSQMDIEITTDSRRGKSKRQAEDEEMAEIESDDEAQTSLEATHIPSSSSTQLSESASKKKKKKRGGKKNKKKNATVNGDGNLFENNDGWEDVVMEEN